MADVGVPIESEVTTESTELTQNNTEIFESPLKKQRKEDSNTEKHKRMDRLENRLGGILCCAVCLDLPNSTVFQVIYFCCYTLYLCSQQSFSSYAKPCCLISFIYMFLLKHISLCSLHI